MTRLIIGTILTLLPIIGYFATDGVILAEMDQTIVKLMAAKIIFIAMLFVYIIFRESTTETE